MYVHGWFSQTWSHQCYVSLNRTVLLYFVPALRAKLRAIMLVAIVKTSHINQYGIAEILEPFVESMQQLESVGSVNT